MKAEGIAITRAVVDVGRFAASACHHRREAGTPARFICVGRLAPEKNLRFLLRSFSQFTKRANQRSAQLVIVGTGEGQEQLLNDAAKLGIESQVEFKGYIPQEQLPALYQSADFFILPSLCEPWGLVVAEAMLCRLPVLVSTQCGCAADLIRPDTGWQFSPWDENALAEILWRASSLDSKSREQMGDAAFRLAQEYSPSKSAGRILEALKAIQPPK